MGLGDFFGFGKDEKKHFRIPHEIVELRMRIESENREKYPNLARYKEIAKEAESVYQYLHDIIAKKEHAEDATKIRDDIRKKLAALEERIKLNIQEARKEGKQDYVEKNIDYLERKSMRNNAKTVFTEFLEAAEPFTLYCKEGRLKTGETIESVCKHLFKTVSELDTSYFKIHGKDVEIQALKEKTLRKLSEVHAVFKENKSRFSDKWLAATIETNLKKLLDEIMA